MAVPKDLDLKLPYITEGILGISGRIRGKPEDFIVDEIPAYQPVGYGDHIFLNITKSLKTTRDTQIELAKLFDLQRENVGHAGLKDKFAITTQTFSLLLPKSEPDEVAKIVEDNLGVIVNWALRHPKKLRSGHLKGNLFKVKITELEKPVEIIFERANKIASLLQSIGCPNYYGVQRIGKNGGNVIEGYEILGGRYLERNRWLRRYLVSSTLSYLCNLYLAERVRHGIFTRLLVGDLAKKHDTGGVFTVEDLSKEQPRCDAKEISFTAPIYGYKMRNAKADAKKLEDMIFESSGLTLGGLRENRVIGTRRMGRLLPEIDVNKTQNDLMLSFALPAGGYATTILREFTKNEEIPLVYQEPDMEDEDET